MEAFIAASLKENKNWNKNSNKNTLTSAKPKLIIPIGAAERAAFYRKYAGMAAN